MANIQEVSKAMADHGFFLNDTVTADGKIHRFKRDQHDKGKSAWYLCFQNASNKGEQFYVCEFGDWREPGDTRKYVTSFVQTKYDKAVVEAQHAEARRKFEAEQIVKWEEVAAESLKEWKKFRTRGETEYTRVKKIKDLCGARMLPGILFVPARDLSGKIWGYQRIFDNGGKFFREGTKKDGNFHLIGDWRAGDLLYVTEGYATGCAIHEATGKAVAIAFDSGNLLAVASVFRGASKDSPLVICGDDDRWNTKPDGTPQNPGREKAEEAAKLCLGKAIFPEFSSLADRPTDFDDLKSLDGIDAVKAQIEGTKTEVHRILCLGHLGESYYYTSTSNQQIVSISRGSHAQGSLLDLMPLDYWESQYPGKSGPDWLAAASALMETCRKNGVFHPERVRGAGVWLDEKKTVVNMGNRLWVDGKIVPLNSFKSKHTYCISSRMELLHEKFVTVEEGTALVNALSLIRWKKPEFAQLFAGWLVVAPLCGALLWRPHIWLNGASGSGKSWIMNNVVDILLKDISFFFQGGTSEAGVRQRAVSDAKAVIFDEFETDDEKSSEKIQAILELLRQASFETEGSVVKGTTGGRSIEYRVRMAAMVASIRTNLQREQDANRFTQLDLERAPGGEQFDALKKAMRIVTPEFGARLFSRGVHRLAVILENQETLYDIFNDTHGGRFAQQYGTLLAGYASLINDKPLTKKEAKILVDLIDLRSESEETDSRDEGDCLSHLLHRVISLDLQDEGGRRDMTIASAIQAQRRAVSTKTAEAIDAALQGFGIKVKDSWFFISRNNPQLKGIFRGTKWTSGWAKPMLRINDAEQGQIRINHASVKCVKIPLDRLGLE